MSNICNIKYVDAWYTYEKDVGKTVLPPHESYGYVEKKGDDIIIVFIKRLGSEPRSTINAGEPIVKGLVIPDKALLSASSAQPHLLKSAPSGSRVTVTWRDIRYVANVSEYQSAIMRTKGVLHAIEKDHIVLKDPNTSRLYPTKKRIHPASQRQTFLIIPTSFITDLVVKKRWIII